MPDHRFLPPWSVEGRQGSGRVYLPQYTKDPVTGELPG